MTLGPLIGVPCLQRVLMLDGCCTCNYFNVKSRCGRVVFKNFRFYKGTYLADLPLTEDPDSETLIGGPYEFEANAGIDQTDLGEGEQKFEVWMQGAGPIPWWKYWDAALWPDAVAPARTTNYISFLLECDPLGLGPLDMGGIQIGASVFFGQFIPGEVGAPGGFVKYGPFSRDTPHDVADFEINAPEGWIKIKNWSGTVAWPGGAADVGNEYVRLAFDTEFYVCEPPDCLEDCESLCAFAFCISTPECFGTCTDPPEGGITGYACSITGVATWNDRIQSWVSGGLGYSAGCDDEGNCVTCEDFLSDPRSPFGAYYGQVPLNTGSSAAAFETLTIDCADGTTFTTYTAGNLGIFTCGGSVDISLYEYLGGFGGPCGPENDDGGSFSGTWSITCPDGPVVIDGDFDTPDCDGEGTGGGTPIDPNPDPEIGLCHFLPSFTVHHPTAGDGIFASVTTEITEIGDSGVWMGGASTTITFPTGPTVMHANLTVVFNMATEELSVIVVIVELGVTEFFLISGDGTFMGFLWWMWPGQTVTGGPGGTTFDIPVNWITQCLIG